MREMWTCMDQPSNELSAAGMRSCGDTVERGGAYAENPGSLVQLPCACAEDPRSRVSSKSRAGPGEDRGGVAIREGPA